MVFPHNNQFLRLNKKIFECGNCRQIKLYTLGFLKFDQVIRWQAGIIRNAFAFSNFG